MWKCEFCGATNPVDLDEEELPRDDDVTFMLQPAPCTAASGKSGLDQSLVVFCVDTSGSMCVTTEVRVDNFVCPNFQQCCEEPKIVTFAGRQSKHLC